MAQDDEPKNDETSTDEQAERAAGSEAGGEALVRAQPPGEGPPGDEGSDELPGGEAPVEQVASELGVLKYVQAAFFAAGILAAYLSGKILLAAWNALADWPEAVRMMPVLIQYAEEERASWTLIIGAVVGVLLVLRYYRRPAVKSWATDVAGELARVTWPNKETVTNGTIVVLVAGAVAGLYVAVLDRLWGYLTNLIYGA